MTTTILLTIDTNQLLIFSQLVRFSRAIVDIVLWIIDAHLASIFVHELDSPDIPIRSIVISTHHPLDGSVHVKLDRLTISK